LLGLTLALVASRKGLGRLLSWPTGLNTISCFGCSAVNPAIGVAIAHRFAFTAWLKLFGHPEA